MVIFGACVGVDGVAGVGWSWFVVWVLVLVAIWSQPWPCLRVELKVGVDVRVGCMLSVSVAL